MTRKTPLVNKIKRTSFTWKKSLYRMILGLALALTVVKLISYPISLSSRQCLHSYTLHRCRRSDIR